MSGFSTDGRLELVLAEADAMRRLAKLLRNKGRGKTIPHDAATWFDSIPDGVAHDLASRLDEALTKEEPQDGAANRVEARRAVEFGQRHHELYTRLEQKHQERGEALRGLVLEVTRSGSEYAVRVRSRIVEAPSESEGVSG